MATTGTGSTPGAKRARIRSWKEQKVKNFLAKARDQGGAPF